MNPEEFREFTNLFINDRLPWVIATSIVALVIAKEILYFADRRQKPLNKQETQERDALQIMQDGRRQRLRNQDKN